MDRSTRSNVVAQLSTRGVVTDCFSESPPLPGESDVRDWFVTAAPLTASRERLTRLVRAIEAEVIPRLVEAHRPGEEMFPEVSRAVPDEADIRAFVDLSTAGDPAPMHAHIDAMLARGVPVAAIFMDLLAPAARALGRMWDTDQCDFTDVTVGVGRMQQVLRDLSPAFGSEVDFPADARRVLLAPAPSEQHTFGLAMVADFFRQAGWEVVGGTGGPQRAIAEQVASEWFDVVGFSVGSETRVEWLKSSIAAVRKASRNNAVTVMIGGPILSLKPGLAEQVGADVGSVDGMQAPVQAEMLVSLRSRRPRVR